MMSVCLLNHYQRSPPYALGRGMNMGFPSAGGVCPLGSISLRCEGAEQTGSNISNGHWPQCQDKENW